MGLFVLWVPAVSRAFFWCTGCGVELIVNAIPHRRPQEVWACAQCEERKLTWRHIFDADGMTVNELHAKFRRLSRTGTWTIRP